jgi:8-demethyl-8-(2-methoxy-alpha-L-rhamnosyl)tetracenomycin-C 3'-O-methyltransferase
MLSLDELFLKHGTDKSSLNHNYAPTYERYINPARVKSLLELGVDRGASLRAWRDWLPWADIHGIEINYRLGIEGCVIHYGNATDKVLIDRLGVFDLIIDDASHETAQIERSLELLWPHLSSGGWYVIEDLAANGNVGGVALFLRPGVNEVHRHGEIIFARKGG